MKITKQAAQIILSAMMVFFAAGLAFDIRTQAGGRPVVDSIILLLMSWAGLIASRRNETLASVLMLLSSAAVFAIFAGDYTYAVYVYFGLYLLCGMLLLVNRLLARRPARGSA